MAGIIPFDNVSMLRAIEKSQSPADTPVLSRHFRNAGVLPSSTAQVDLITGPEGLMVAISRESESRKAAQEGVTTKTFTIPRFSEKDSVSASDLALYRAPGMANGSLGQQQLISRRLGYMRSRLNSTKEVMAIGALKGSVVDGAGNVIATFPVGSDGAISVGTTNPREYFDDAAVAISRALRVANVNLVTYVGKDAYKRLLMHSDMKAMLASGPGVITRDAMNTVYQTEIVRVNGAYTDNQGNEQPYLGDDDMITVADGDYFELYHGPCSTKQGLALQEMIVVQWETEDAPLAWFRLESNPLPIVQRPEASRIATLVN